MQRRLLALGFGLLTLPVSAAAQTTQAAPITVSPSDARLQFGPLALQPHIGVSDVGIDTNVFNSDSHRRSDFTATIIPSLDSRLRVGRGLVTAKTSVEFVYFKDTPSQRSSGFSQDGRFDLPLARLTPFFFGGHQTTHQRPNAEIDERVKQATDNAGAGASVRLGARTTVTVQGERKRIEYGEPGLDGSADIARALNRRSSVQGLSFFLELTPLTTFAVKAEFEQDRFEISPIRDSNNATIMGGFYFKPSALISGSAFAGYRQLTAISPLLRDYTGLEAAVDASYLWRERTRVTAKVDRSLEYSVDATAPYYVSTGGTVSVTQSLGGRWDGVGRLGRAGLAYQTLVDAVPIVPAEGRNDTQVTRSAGVGYHLGADMRIGFDVVYTSRLSAAEDRKYEGYRFGGSFTYAY